MVIVSGETGIRVLMEPCQRVLDGKGMTDEWKTSVVVPIFKGKGDVMNCGAYMGNKVAGAWYEDCGKGVGEKNMSINKIG